MFARAGADVGITYHTRVAEAEAVARRSAAWDAAASLPGATWPIRRGREVSAGSARPRFGGLDCFVANAGIWPSDDVPLGRMTEDRWRSTMSAEPRRGVPHHPGRARRDGKGGRVVLVSSTAGQRGEAFHADYAATKGALISMTKSLAVEYAPDITVNCVAPGWVDTEMSAAAFADGGRERIAATIPLRRIPPAEDIAGPILFLVQRRWRGMSPARCST